jgi:deazaflavin-dependent oxidoreductase (nitroreductase family)
LTADDTSAHAVRPPAGRASTTPYDRTVAQTNGAELARAALRADPTIDITTTGRRTGQPRRLEIWMLAVGERFFITGTPGPRAWLANLIAHPELTVHLHDGEVDLPARAVPVTDAATRREVLEDAAARWYRGQTPIDDLVATAPMVEVTFT